MYDLLIEDATILTEGHRRVADIAIEGGVIAYVGDRPGGRSREKISAIGRFVMPGAIDFCTRRSGSETWSTLSRAAASTGVTTLIEVCDATGPDTVARYAAEASDSMVSHGRWARATPDNAGVLSSSWASGDICGAVLDLAALSEDAVEAHFAAGAGLLGVQADGVDGIKQVLPLVRTHRRSTHLFNLSTTAEINLLDPLRRDLPLTADITPAHLFLSVETSVRVAAALSCRPPIRPELERRAMWTALKRGQLDCFTSGHVPTPHTPPGEVAPGGLPGMDAMLRLLMAAVSSGRLGLEALAQMCAEAPARILGLAGKGQIAVGADADLVLFAEGELTRLTSESLHSAAGWSPYLGRSLAVAPQYVIIGGRIAAREGQILSDHAAGPVRYQRS